MSGSANGWAKHPRCSGSNPLLYTGEHVNQFTFSSVTRCPGLQPLATHDPIVPPPYSPEMLVCRRT